MILKGSADRRTSIHYKYYEIDQHGTPVVEEGAVEAVEVPQKYRCLL